MQPSTFPWTTILDIKEGGKEFLPPVIPNQARKTRKSHRLGRLDPAQQKKQKKKKQTNKRKLTAGKKDSKGTEQKRPNTRQEVQSKNETIGATPLA